MINIFGVIGAEVRATEVIKQIQAYDGEVIDVVISSPGGSVFEGMAIYDALKASGKTINTSILGLGASIASVIFMAGDKREMGEGSQLMIHNALTTQGGNKHELSEAIDRLDAIDAQMSSIYINATGMDKETIAEMLKQETFMTADEAIEKGFATNKSNPLEMVAFYNKQKTEAIMPEEQEKEEKSFLAHIKSFFAVDKAEEEAMEEEEPKAMEEEDEEEPSEDAMEEEKEESMEEEEEKAESEVEALKAKIEQLEGELKAKHEAEFIAKKDAIFEAIADNKLTLAQGKELASESGDVVTEKLKGLEANATGYGRKDEEVPNVPKKSALAKYEALTGSEKQSFFVAHKEEILNEMNKEA